MTNVLVNALAKAAALVGPWSSTESCQGKQKSAHPLQDNYLVSVVSQALEVPHNDAKKPTL